MTRSAALAERQRLVVGRTASHGGLTYAVTYTE